MNADSINALFEFGGASLLFLNVRQLWLDKRLAGVRILPTAWYSCWGFWNLYYYHSLNQTFSWLAGFIVVAANTSWVVLAMMYRKNSSK